MENMKHKLREYFLDEEILEENEGEHYLHYNATLGGERFRVAVGVNKNPSKLGIKVKFYPINEQNIAIPDLTPEELQTTQNALATTISKKFNEFGLEFDRDTDAPDKQAINFQIPLDSVFTFIRDKVLGGGPEEENREEPEGELEAEA
jgi:hypothetical protein